MGDKYTEQDLDGLPLNVLRQHDKLQDMLKAKDEGNQNEGSEGEVPAEDAAAEEIIPEDDGIKDAVVDDPDGKDDAWEHKYKAFQGVHRANMDEMKGRINLLKQNLDESAKTIENLNKAVSMLKESTPQEKKSSDVDPQDGSFNPSDYEDYGEEMVKLVTAVNKLTKENKTLRDGEIGKIKNLEDRVAVSDEDRFFSKLERVCPEWESVDADPKWLEWLAESDPLTGARRQDILSSFRQRLDVNGVANVFKTFGNKSDVNGTPALVHSARVVPRRAAASTLGGEKKQITPQDYRNMATAVTRGEMSHEDFDKITKQFQTSLRG